MMLKIVLLAVHMAQRDAMVADEAKRIGFPADVAVAVSHTENWRAIDNAVSNRGAIGWMQVEPVWVGTFKQACGPAQSLTVPTYNVCIGVHVLRFYWFRCHHNINCTLIAYNGATEFAVSGREYIASVRENL